MTRTLIPMLAAVCLATAAGPALACQTCDPASGGDGAFTPLSTSDPLRIRLETGFTFQRVSPVGEAIIEAEKQARFASGRLAGSPGLVGRLELKGEKDARVRIDLPRTVRIMGPGGDLILVRDVEFDRPGPYRLDGDGYLELEFAGLLEVTDAPTPGSYRTDLVVSADYY